MAQEFGVCTGTLVVLAVAEAGTGTFAGLAVEEVGTGTLAGLAVAEACTGVDIEVGMGADTRDEAGIPHGELGQGRGLELELCEYY